MTVPRRIKRHDTTFLEEGDFIWRMQLWKLKMLVLHKIAYSAPAEDKVIEGNIEAVRDIKCLDLHNSMRYGLIAAAQKICNG